MDYDALSLLYKDGLDPIEFGDYGKLKIECEVLRK